jgi:hypothetical protein
LDTTTRQNKKRRNGMLDMTFRSQLTNLFDRCRSDHLRLEAEVLSSPAVGLTRVRQAEHLSILLNTLFEGIDHLIGDDAVLYRDALALLTGHPLYRDVFMQSMVVASRAKEQGDGLFDFRFRRLVFDRSDIGSSPYVQMLNEALLDLPPCRAIRTLSDSLERMISVLPEGSSVLGLECSPAPDILSLPASLFEKLKLELHESRLDAIRHLTQFSGKRDIAIVQTDPQSPLPESGQWDLILAPYFLTAMTAGYDYRDDAAKHILRLFQRLAPGGRLLMASPLVTGGENPYRHSHRMLLDRDDTQSAIHRSPADLISLTSLLADSDFGAAIVNEDLTTAIGGATVLAVLVIQASK